MITKTCSVSGKKFIITGDDKRFYEKMGVPEPTLCPEEELQRLSAFMNVFYLYRKNQIISPYSNQDYNIISFEEWNSDKVDGRSFGRDYDFSRSFFDQFKDLQKVAPRWDRCVLSSENSDWCLNVDNVKDSYLLRSAKDVEHGFYSRKIYGGRDFSDCESCKNIELSYEVLDGENCFQVYWSELVENVRDAALLFDCRNVHNCLCCVGLRNKEYYFCNEEVSKEKFNDLWKKFHADKIFREECFKKFEKAKQAFPRKASVILSSENASGDKIYNSKNVQECFEIRNYQDSKYCINGSENKDVLFSISGDYQELTCKTVVTYQLYNCFCCFNAFDMRDCSYIETSAHLKDCFGCVGLKKAQYCILNKQYTETEYKEQRTKIREHMKETGEWGAFFPVELSPFAYNETSANEYFPLTKEKAQKQGYKWKDEESSSRYKGPKYEIPEDIKRVEEGILEAILTCEVTGKNYRIVRPELEFYRKMNLPIPRICPDERHRQRMALRNPRQLWDRKCSECQKEIQTTYSPDRTEKVLCEECYLSVVV